MLFFFARSHDRDQNAEARHEPTSHENVTKQHDAAVSPEKSRITRMKNDPKSFVLCPYNVRLQPRRPLTIVSKSVAAIGRRLVQSQLASS
jgi:hypothetical protein